MKKDLPIGALERAELLISFLEKNSEGISELETYKNLNFINNFPFKGYFKEDFFLESLKLKSSEIFSEKFLKDLDKSLKSKSFLFYSSPDLKDELEKFVVDKILSVIGFPVLEVDCKVYSSEIFFSKKEDLNFRPSKITEAFFKAGSQQIIIFLKNLDFACKDFLKDIYKILSSRMFPEDFYLGEQIEISNVVFFATADSSDFLKEIDLLSFFKILKLDKNSFQPEFLENKFRDCSKSLKDKRPKKLGFKERFAYLERFSQEKDFFSIELEKFNLPKKIYKLAAKDKSEIISEFSKNTALFQVCNHLKIILSLPYYSEKKELFSISQVKKRLDELHLGLFDLKERVLDYLALKYVEKNKNSFDKKVFCFVGPCGVGKSSFAKAIAKSLGLEFRFISLAGVENSNQIKGWPKSYFQAEPGFFIKSLSSCTSNDPVVLLDEVDKVSDQRAIYSILQAIDREQSSKFFDNFLSFEYDLSNVFFILTANDAEKIPQAIKSRCEIINFDGYNFGEKFQIIKNFIIPNLNKKVEEKYQLEISENLLRFICKELENEPGVREIESLLKKIFEKNVKSILTLKEPLRLSRENLLSDFF